ncbi:MULTISPECIES: CoA pyrophosphatase [unclassified Herbaspirillum]|uniref:CoA pyrophosphatase n=1 Tax=unclassified Herbaspirillum TaxID=2624150 RepID=UPI000E2E7E02|nr:MULTISPECIES: CoA pyrophosphatase [unclassified Herbaspirillum]RFB68546.1 CoA pyrophosphatase [Herbaspirillum sp. 3R-3a1]TFI05448.1 CoA pyrophosphatase [Herbaspirillum sp. 3R11]TFI13641.1 CoA pyrophosphatase [Herbaspirillum sp. 3R-11]TFI24381.1 CoA pyrophosphatase [Herbaspirillum sp. 3C11]
MAIFDPLDLPIESVAGEARLDAERMQEEWLRRRFTEERPWTPEINVEQQIRQVAGTPRPAAVLMPIVLREQGPTLLFTQRTADLKDHAGQISFPGGRTELSDVSPVDTALRETEEEIGLARRHVEVIGSLPEYFTGTGYRVTPVAGLIRPPFDVVPDPREVAEIFEVPLAFLMDGMNHQRRTIELPNDLGRRTFYTMPYERFFIWGATAGMLRNLFHFLRS